MIEVIKMSPHHWPAVREIYLEGIETGNATFELDAPPWKKWDEVHHAFGRVLALESEVIRGWAAMTPVSSRTAYSGVADVSVYVAAHSRGSGVGRLLLNALIAESEENDIWTLQAGIFPENEASIALHKRCGFREVGRRERIGKLNGIWRSTLLLERRSELVGTR